MAKKLKKGDKFVFHNSKSNEALMASYPDITLGRIYIVCGEDFYGQFYFNDDAGEHNYAAYNLKYTIIVN